MMSRRYQKLLVTNSSRLFCQGPGRYVQIAAAQLALVSAEFRHMALHQTPVALPMIEVAGVTQFVNQHVPHEGARQEQQIAVEADGTACRTAAPAAALSSSNRGASCAHACSCNQRRSARSNSSSSSLRSSRT